MTDAELPVTAAATFCSTVVDEWVRCGVTHAVVAPGSRSTPLVLALSQDRRVRVEVHHDERSAGFLALGLGRATGRPAVVVTTSGTAAVELHPAVVEAHQAGVPLIACTADRPPELRDVGAPQAIDQTHLFGRSVRWFHDPGVPDDAASGSWRSVAARAVLAATGSPPGPVHLNLPFREPLTGRAAVLPAGRSAEAPWHEAGMTVSRVDRHHLDVLCRHCARHEGVIVAGGEVGDPAAVLVLAHELGWPVLADPRSGCRVPDAAVVAHFDPILRAAGADLRPEVVLRLGAPPASKALGRWLAQASATEIAVERHGRWLDADRSAAVLIDADPATVCRELAAQVEDGRAVTPWLSRWAEAERLAAGAIAGVVARHEEPTEPAIARDVVMAVPDGGSLVVSSSMPVRDLEWFAPAREGITVHANRGANGIDGVVSTALGVALGSASPTVALLGDLAFLHDSNGLLRAADRDADLVLVVVDNDGGGIFSFLPQAGTFERDGFERFFGTPHHLELAALAAAHGVPAERVERQADLPAAVAKALAAGGVQVVVVGTDRAANVVVHEEIERAVAEVLSPTTG